MAEPIEHDNKQLVKLVSQTELVTAQKAVRFHEIDAEYKWQAEDLHRIVTRARADYLNIQSANLAEGISEVT